MSTHPYSRKPRDPKLNVKRRLARIHKNVRAGKMAMDDLVRALEADTDPGFLSASLNAALATIELAMLQVSDVRNHVIAREIASKP